MLVGDIEDFVDNRQTGFDVFNWCVAWWNNMHSVEVCKRPEIALFAGHDQICHWFGISTRCVKRYQWFTSLAVFDVFDRPEHTKTAHIAHAWMLCLDFFECWADDVFAEHSGVFNDFFFFENID